MTTALVFLSGTQSDSILVPDLEAAGIEVLLVTHECHMLVHEVLLHAPDMVIFDAPTRNDALFKATLSLMQTSARAVMVFTQDDDSESIVRAMESGIHAYVVNGYAAHRLPSLIQVAQARFRREQAIREELQDISSRFEERRWVDRAKGILMRAREVSDDDAFHILRTTSMHTNQRLGQVSQNIIHSARFAESVNRAGQLRMLSQRLIKLYLLQLAGVDSQHQKQCLQESILRVDRNLGHLLKTLSKPAFGDCLTQVQTTWTRLKSILQGELRTDRILLMEELAERLLLDAERLTGNLENAGSAAPLQVLNMVGRQRMLSQRFAKYALLSVLGNTALVPRSVAGLSGSKVEFEKALGYLNEIPLTTQDIRTLLQTAAIEWTKMQAGAANAEHPSGQEAVALASESLLEVFEKLSSDYERSMQMLVG